MKKIEKRIQSHINTFIVTANPEIVMYARKHPKYRQIINQADYITPDGIGIIKASQMLNQPMPERISGYDILINLLNWGNQKKKSVYFLGAHQSIINDLVNTVYYRYPGLNIAGTHNGYFTSSTNIIKSIKSKQPDMIFVALGYPKQELFIKHHRKIDNALWIGVGGSFDILSGHKKRAPHFWIHHHIEWLYRLISNPWRFKRMLSLPKFIIKIGLQKYHFLK